MGVEDLNEVSPKKRKKNEKQDFDPSHLLKAG